MQFCYFESQHSFVPGSPEMHFIGSCLPIMPFTRVPKMQVGRHRQEEEGMLTKHDKIHNKERSDRTKSNPTGNMLSSTTASLQRYQFRNQRVVPLLSGAQSRTGLSFLSIQSRGVWKGACGGVASCGRTLPPRFVVMGPGSVLGGTCCAAGVKLQLKGPGVTDSVWRQLVLMS